jgi:hypothetical protein
MKKPQTFMMDTNVSEKLKLVQIDLNKKKLPSEPVITISDLVNEAVRIHLEKYPLDIQAHLDEIEKEKNELIFYRIASDNKDFVLHLINMSKFNGTERLADQIKPSLEKENWALEVSEEINRISLELGYRQRELEALLP